VICGLGSFNPTSEKQSSLLTVTYFSVPMLWSQWCTPACHRLCLLSAHLPAFLHKHTHSMVYTCLPPAVFIICAPAGIPSQTHTFNGVNLLATGCVYYLRTCRHSFTNTHIHLFTLCLSNSLVILLCSITQTTQLC